MNASSFCSESDWRPCEKEPGKANKEELEYACFPTITSIRLHGSSRKSSAAETLEIRGRKRWQTNSNLNFSNRERRSGILAPMINWLMKLFGEALEKRASVCYTFRIFHAESVARECLPHLYFHYPMGLKSLQYAPSNGKYTFGSSPIV
jgi:hypothetical protein